MLSRHIDYKLECLTELDLQVVVADRFEKLNLNQDESGSRFMT